MTRGRRAAAAARPADARPARPSAAVSRREFIAATATAAAAPWALVATAAAADDTEVNDVHSRLNATTVAAVAAPDTLDALCAAVRSAGKDGRPLCVAGGRHAMGGQQFATDALLLDTRRLNRVLGLDRERGIVDVEAGIRWPELIAELQRLQPAAPAWSIRQKQTGADRLTLGGALAANIHGRGLRMPPIIGDVESLVLVDARGRPRPCSRTENHELFRLVIGGYGLFGIVYSVKLRLAPRVLLQRIVELADTERLSDAFAQRIAAGFEFGDCQLAIDPRSDDFLRRGVFSCYRRAAPAASRPASQRALAASEWQELTYLAHTDKARAFELYARHYLATSGQLYGSDTHQLSTYLDDYHAAIEQRSGSAPGSEIISEIYTPRDALERFLADVRQDFRANGVDLIYSTIRLIEPDAESFLAWARQPWACTIFNLHSAHDPAALERTAGHFRRLIDLALRYGGSYYLTYHRYATRDQLTTCYPQFAEFLRLKRQQDPALRFQSNWYRHYRALFDGP